MNKTDYMQAINDTFLLGRADAYANSPKQAQEGSYAAGYDGYFLPTSIEQTVMDTASKGWDDGSKGAARSVPAITATFTVPAVVEDLQKTYNFAYDLGSQNAGAVTPGKTSYTGWIVGIGAVALGAWILYAMKKSGEGQMTPAHANPVLLVPKKNKEEVRYQAHGKTLVVKKVSPGNIHIWIEGERSFAPGPSGTRWATLDKDAREDIQYFLDTGSLPREKNSRM